MKERNELVENIIYGAIGILAGIGVVAIAAITLGVDISE